uniref:Uncharacterized protein n=1 Tax=viral metagenome TaxID=1070528 RepID=A0A6M3XVP5_9ZZZZ
MIAARKLVGGLRDAVPAISRERIILGGALIPCLKRRSALIAIRHMRGARIVHLAVGWSKDFVHLNAITKTSMVGRLLRLLA